MGSHSQCPHQRCPHSRCLYKRTATLRPGVEPAVESTTVAVPPGVVEEPVPITLWPLPAAPAEPASRGEAGNPVVDGPMAAVLARVLARYAWPGARVVVDVAGLPTQPGDRESSIRQADLIVAAPHPDSPAAVVNRYRQQIQAMGLLIVVSSPATGADVAVVVASARAAGFCYLQHNVAFPAGRPESAGTIARRGPAGGGHERIHTDVLVFAKAERSSGAAHSNGAGGTDG